MKPVSIGFIGIGNVGSNLTNNLLKSNNNVFVYDNNNQSYSRLKNLKNKNFKLVIKGELSLELLNSFVSLDINRDGNALNLINYEVIEKDLSKNK